MSGWKPNSQKWVAFVVAGLVCMRGTITTANAQEKPFVLGDLVVPFNPPPLAELDQQADWQERPVRDSLQLMRERQAKESVLATAAEALALKNSSPEINAKICSALGRLAPADDAVDWSAEWNRHSMGDVTTTNPILTSSVPDADVYQMIGFTPFGFDWTFDPFASADAVSSWSTSRDGLIDKVILRDDLTWSDGKPITAHDIEFSFRVIMSSQVPVRTHRSGTEELKSVKAYDDRTVVYFHKAALATNVWNLNFPVIPQHIYEKSIAEDPTLARSPHHVQHDQNPVTGGPYTVELRERGQKIVLARRESYYMHQGKQVRAKPYFQRINYRIIQDPNTALLALKRGDIEEMNLTPEHWQTQTTGKDFYEKNIKASGLEWVTFHFAWNCKTPLFSDRRVRQAMGYAFDHAEMLKKHRYGLDEPCTGIFHPTSRWSPQPAPHPIQRDLEKAEALLADAGWEDTDSDGVLDKEIGGKSVPFEFTMLVSNRQDRIDICNLLRENLDQIGIVCHVRPTEFTVLQDNLNKHQFQAAMGGWGTGADPDYSKNLWTTDAIANGRNHGQYSNPEVDRLFALGKQELDLAKRAAIYQKIHQILWEDQPYTWLYFQNSYYGFNKRLRGYNFSPRGPYHYSPGDSSIYKPVLN